MLLHLKNTFENHQPYWLNGNSEFQLSFLTGSVEHLFSFIKPTLFNSEHLRGNTLLIITIIPNNQQRFLQTWATVFIRQSSIRSHQNGFIQTNSHKRIAFDIFIPKLNSQQTHPTAFHFLSLLLSSPHSFFMYTPALQGRNTRSLNMYPAVMI